MQHIAIEGMDGVGKTTASKLLAKRLGYKFIDKTCVNYSTTMALTIIIFA